MMYLIIVKAVIKMNTTKYMIIIKGEIKTRDIKFLEQDDASHKMNVTFNNRKTYSYILDNVEFLENPKFLDPRKYHLSKDGKNFFSVEAIYEFVGKDATYIHVCFKNNVERDYYKSQLDIQESYLNKKDAANVFDYIKETSKLSNLKNERENLKVYESTETNVVENEENVKTKYIVKLVINNITYDQLNLVVKGDIDGDGYITVADVTLAENSILRLSKLDKIEFVAADIDIDNYVTVADVTKMQNYILRLNSSLNTDLYEQLEDK